MSEIDEKRLWIIEARDGAWGANGICKGELVRCGECKYWDEKPLIKNGKSMTRFGVCRICHDGYLKADFYCADGERRTDEQQT